MPLRHWMALLHGMLAGALLQCRCHAQRCERWWHEICPNKVAQERCMHCICSCRWCQGDDMTCINVAALLLAGVCVGLQVDTAKLHRDACMAAGNMCCF